MRNSLNGSQRILNRYNYHYSDMDEATREKLRQLKKYSPEWYCVGWGLKHYYRVVIAQVQCEIELGDIPTNDITKSIYEQLDAEWYRTLQDDEDIIPKVLPKSKPVQLTLF